MVKTPENNTFDILSDPTSPPKPATKLWEGRLNRSVMYTLNRRPSRPSRGCFPRDEPAGPRVGENSTRPGTERLSRQCRACWRRAGVHRAGHLTPAWGRVRCACGRSLQEAVFSLARILVGFVPRSAGDGIVQGCSLLSLAPHCLPAAHLRSPGTADGVAAGVLQANVPSSPV